MDPRNPERPITSNGDNWVICKKCGRSANKIRLVRHTEECPYVQAKIAQHQNEERLSMSPQRPAI